MVRKKALTLALVMALAAALCGCGNPDYDEAGRLMEAGEFAEARELYIKIEEEGGYKDSAVMVQEAQYQLALKQMEEEQYTTACLKFDELGDYGDSAQMAQQCVDSLMEKARKNSYVYFGRWEQDGDEANGPERILWNVLESEEDCLLLCANRVFETAAFGESVDWAGSSLRTWLNGDFYSSAFDGHEKTMIQTALTAKSYTDENLPEGLATEIAELKSAGLSAGEIYGLLPQSVWDEVEETELTDRVFLLSAEEARGLYPDDTHRKAQVTEAMDLDKDYCGWWTRSVGTDYSLTEEDEGYKGVVWVSDQGSVKSSGKAPGEVLGVRPVICIKRAGSTEDEALNLSLFGYPSDKGLDNESRPAPTKPGSGVCPACKGTGTIRFYYGSSDLEALLTGHDPYTLGTCPMCNGRGR